MPSAGTCERLQHREDQIGLADRPAFGELGALRQVGPVAFRRAASTHAAIVSICSWLRLRSLANLPTPGSAPHGGISRVDDLLLDRARPRPGIFVGHQRHRRHRVGPMALDTALVKDGRDVFAVGRRRGRSGRPGHRPRRWQPMARTRGRREERPPHHGIGYRIVCRMVPLLGSRAVREPPLRIR